MMTTSGSLLNDILPQYDVSAVYSIRIYASPERVYEVLQRPLPQGRATRILMTLRSIPSFFQAKRRPPDGNSFYRLKAIENQEIVLGIAGQFWKPVAVVIPIHSLDDFTSFSLKDHCKAAINLRISSHEPGVSIVSTETRILAFGPAKRKFRRYWRLIAPFSGLIRKDVLRKIKRDAERGFTRSPDDKFT